LDSYKNIDEIRLDLSKKRRYHHQKFTRKNNDIERFLSEAEEPVELNNRRIDRLSLPCGLISQR
jgi:hypothetical protein